MATLARAGGALVLAGGLLCCSPQPLAAGSAEPAREILRQQSVAERRACGGVRRALGAGHAPDAVVRTAVALGFGGCEVVRCAVEAGADLGTVLAAAAEAGVPMEVLARCAVDQGAEPSAVAELLGRISSDPYLCYFGPGIHGMAPVVPPGGGPDRRYPRPELSPFLP